MNEQSKPNKRARLMYWASAIFILAAIAWGLWWLLHAGRFETTDDAYVHGNMVPISAQIPGTVVSISADDTRMVTQGEPLLALDDNDTRIALEQAEAALAQTVRQTHKLYLQNDALQAALDMRAALVAQAESLLEKANNDLQRRQNLRGSGGVSGEEVLHAQVAAKAASAELAQAKAALVEAQARLAANQSLTLGTAIDTHPDVLRASAQLRQAWLAQERTRIVAPLAGMLAQRTVQIGQHITPGAPLLSVVPLDSLWVEANFKENQLHAMQAGQEVSLQSDIYGKDVIYHGTIEGIAAGSGSAFALLPAQNASGNWIKVIQRVPVRIRLRAAELSAHPLRIGLSMTAKVDLQSAAPADQRAPLAPQQTSVYQHDETALRARIEQIIRANGRP